MKRERGVYLITTCIVGDGENGKLGHGDKVSLTVPKRINIKKKIIGISCGAEHSVALTDNLEVV